MASALGDRFWFRSERIWVSMDINQDSSRRARGSDMEIDNQRCAVFPMFSATNLIDDTKNVTPH